MEHTCWYGGRISNYKQCRGALQVSKSIGGASLSVLFLSLSIYLQLWGALPSIIVTQGSLPVDLEVIFGNPDQYPGNASITIVNYGRFPDNIAVSLPIVNNGGELSQVVQ